jgi:hypothetical protein
MASANELRRQRGVIAMVAGIVVAVIGRLVGIVGVEVTAGALALLLLIGGAMVVANTYREESGRPVGGSRSSLIAHQATSGMRSRRAASGRTASKKSSGTASGARAPAAAPGEAELQLYVASFDLAIGRCRDLLASDPTEVAATQLAEARESLMILVANPRYGQAITRGLLDEVVLREISAQFAERLS